MEIAGGAIVGYWAIGKVSTPTMPPSITSMARTQAKIGRSMKKRDMRGARFCSAHHDRRRGGSGRDRLYRRAGLHIDQAIDDQPIARLQAAGDDPVGSHGPAHL